jgi:hypothetical protein
MGGVPVEEPLQCCGVVGVEGGAGPRTDVERCLLEQLWIAAGEDDVSTVTVGLAARR